MKPPTRTETGAVLFDLDGTLLDTAPDLVFALNQLRRTRGLPDISLKDFRTKVGLGSREMLHFALNMTENDVDFTAMKETFLTLYHQHIADNTQFFPQMESVLNYLDEKNIPWGIVTNKLTTHTSSLLKALQVDHRPKCVICGDTLTKYKPHPLPILHACALLGAPPTTCIYIGDAITDVIASKAAGTRSLVALYGYLDDSDPYSWNADGYIREPMEILQWVKQPAEFD